MVNTFQLTPDGAMLEMGRHASMSDASAELPQGAYTTLRTYKRNRVLRLTQHFRRLEQTLALTGVQAEPINDRLARMAIGRIAMMLNYPESRFRLTFVPGKLFISIERFSTYAPELYENGVWCVSVSLHRNNPHAKSTTFIASATDAYKSLPEGAHEGLMIGDDGAVLEGLSSNFFAIQDGVLHTEQARVLMGVTRSLVLEVAGGVLPAPVGAVTYNDLVNVGECFITSVSRGILPVVKIDQLAIGGGKPGPITRELMTRFDDLVAREAEVLL